MDHISGPDHSTLPTHQTRTLSRRKLLAGAAGGVAVVAAGQPAWAADATRPGAVRGPALAVRDSQVVQAASAPHARWPTCGCSPSSIGPRIGGTASERAAAEYALTSLRSAGCRDVRLEPFPVADKFLADIGDPDGQLPDDICWQAGASPDAGLDAGPVTGRVRRRQGRDRTGVARRPGRGDRRRRARRRRPGRRRRDPRQPARGVRRSRRSGAARRPSSCCRPTWPTPAARPRRRRAWCRRPARPRRRWTPVATIPVLGVAQVQKRLLREDLSVRPLRLTIGTTSHRGLTSNNVLGRHPRSSGRHRPAGLHLRPLRLGHRRPRGQRRRLRHRADARARPGAPAGCPGPTPPSGSRCGVRRSRA